MADNRTLHVERFIHLLGQYIGFVGDIPVGGSFYGDYSLEEQINLEADAIGIRRPTRRYSMTSSSGTGSYLVIYLPHGGGSTSYGMPLDGFTDNERNQLIALLRRWQRSANEPITLDSPRNDSVSVASYERDAYLSYLQAIQENSTLAAKPLKKVYAWIKENGVDVAGQKYVLPPFDTWRKYRRAGERGIRPSAEK